MHTCYCIKDEQNTDLKRQNLIHFDTDHKQMYHPKSHFLSKISEPKSHQKRPFRSFVEMEMTDINIINDFSSILKFQSSTSSSKQWPQK